MKTLDELLVALTSDEKELHKELIEETIKRVEELEEIKKSNEIGLEALKKSREELGDRCSKTRRLLIMTTAKTKKLVKATQELTKSKKRLEDAVKPSVNNKPNLLN